MRKGSNPPLRLNSPCLQPEGFDVDPGRVGTFRYPTKGCFSPAGDDFTS